jgi:tetratricopeptide (TPR) repeat protein
MYRRIGATAKIERVIERIADDVTDEADLEALKLERIRLMMGDGRADEAETELRGVLAAHPQMADAAGLLIEILAHGERLDELRQLLTKLLEQARRSGNAKLTAQYGLELAKLVAASDREEAISVLLGDLELTKGDQSLLRYLLSLYTEADNQSERADVMEHLIAVSPPHDAKALSLELADWRSSMGDQFGVVRALELGVRSNPADAELVERLIDQLRLSGDHAGLAEALMTRAKQLDGGDSVARYTEAGAIFDQYLGEPIKAAAAYEAAYIAEPTIPTYLIKAVDLLVASGEVNIALHKVSEALRNCPEFLVADLLVVRAAITARERATDRPAMIQAGEDLARALQLHSGRAGTRNSAAPSAGAFRAPELAPSRIRLRSGASSC